MQRLPLLLLLFLLRVGDSARPTVSELAVSFSEAKALPLELEPPAPPAASQLPPLMLSSHGSHGVMGGVYESEAGLASEIQTGAAVVIVQRGEPDAGAPLATLSELASSLGPSYVHAHDAVAQATAATAAAALLIARSRIIAAADAFTAGSAAVLKTSVSLSHDLAQTGVDGVKEGAALLSTHAAVHHALFGGR